MAYAGHPRYPSLTTPPLDRRAIVTRSSVQRLPDRAGDRTRARTGRADAQPGSRHQERCRQRPQARAGREDPHRPRQMAPHGIGRSCSRYEGSAGTAVRTSRQHHDHRIGYRYPDREHDDHQRRRPFPACGTSSASRGRSKHRVILSAAAAGAERTTSRKRRARSSSIPMLGPGSRSRCATWRFSAGGEHPGCRAVGPYRRCGTTCNCRLLEDVVHELKK